MNPTFATVVNCMDGRVQIPVNEWACQHFGVEFVDTVTEPGPDRMLTFGPFGKIGAVKEKVAFLVKVHASKGIVLAGHHDCAGNPVPKEDHLDEIRQGVERIVSWGLGVPVVGVWVDENWKCQIVCEAS